MTDLVQTPSQQGQALSGHQSFEERAREITNQFYLHWDGGRARGTWLEHAIASALAAAYEKGVTDGKVDLTKLVMGVFDRLEGEKT